MARVITSPVIDHTCNGVAIVFTDGTIVDFSDGGSGELLWLTARPPRQKRVPLARRVLVRGRKTRPPQNL